MTAATQRPLGDRGKLLSLAPRRVAASALILLAGLCLACAGEDALVERPEYRATLRGADGSTHGEARLAQLGSGVEFVVELLGLPAGRYVAELLPSCDATELAGGPSSLRLFVGADGDARSRILIKPVAEARELEAMRVVIVPDGGGATVACGGVAEERERPSP